MIDETIITFSADLLFGKILRLTLIQRNFVAFVEKQLEIIEHPVALLCWRAVSFAFVQQLNAAP